MKLLIIEDDKEILALLAPLLRSEGFDVDAAQDGQDGLHKALNNGYDLIVLDIVLPSKSGRQICFQIREANKHMPIIMTSAKEEIGTRVDLLSIGADDYLVKPFSLVELVARIKALLRRPNSIASHILRIHDVILDIDKHIVMRGKKQIQLTPKEFFLLEYLMRNQDRVVSRATILEEIWEKDTDTFTNTIETHILNLRKKLGIKNNQDLIVSISGLGYKIVT